MVYFCKRVALTKASLEECNRSLRNTKYHLLANIFLKWLPDEYPLRHLQRIKIFEDFIWPSAYAIKIGWNLRCLLEINDWNFRIFLIKIKEPINFMSLNNSLTLLVIWIFVSFFFSIRHSLPFLRHGYCQLHFCFESRLIKGRENSEAIVHFKLGVKILATIFSIRICVEPTSVRIVWR